MHRYQIIIEYDGSNNYILVGKTSGAKAVVADRRLLSDNVGNVQGTFFVPSPKNDANPRWATGTRNFRFRIYYCSFMYHLFSLIKVFKSFEGYPITLALSGMSLITPLPPPI